MALQPARGDLKALFRANADDVAGAGLWAHDPAQTDDNAIGEVHDLAREIQREAHDKGVRVDFALGDVKNIMGGLRAHSGVHAITEIRDQQEADAKAQHEDALFLLLLNNGNVAEFIADAVFDGMSDAEIADVVADIEAETGMSFEEYAEGILGDDMPERKPGESDDDYNRRVLKAITVEIYDPETEGLKDKYKNDPGAQVIVGIDGFEKIVKQINNWEREYAAGNHEKVESEIAEISKYSDAHTTGKYIAEDPLSNTATGSQDGHRDGEAHSTVSLQESDDVLNDLLSPSTREEPVLAGAPNMGKSFEVASKPADTEGPDIETAPTKVPNPPSLA